MYIINDSRIRFKTYYNGGNPCYSTKTIFMEVI